MQTFLIEMLAKMLDMFLGVIIVLAIVLTAYILYLFIFANNRGRF